ncbi:MAG: WecB/TagA/CpsF family glycosyltransferase [Cellvibrionaceae bacterium]|nr:WecB/TagA/CpsF family glycosyltransferase [Cellvibrionaceae bacterium]
MAEKLIETSLVNFNNITLAAAAGYIREAAGKAEFSYVVTPNIDHLARLAKQDVDGNYSRIYDAAFLSLCDSRIIEKLLRFRSKQIQEVIPGSTLTEHLFSSVLNPQDKVLILGVEDHCIVKLRQQYPTLNLLHINPSMGFINRSDEVAELLDQIKQLQPNFIFLSVGSPRQEVLADKIQQHPGIGGVGLCVGASVLFLVGAEKRAPLLLQKLHLEWAYRMLQDPKRLVSRYAKNFLALPAIISRL